jgi:hypothetical protein
MQNPKANGLSLTLILLLDRRFLDEVYDITESFRLIPL